MTDRLARGFGRLEALSVALLAVGLMQLGSVPQAEAIVVACNATDVYAQMASCPVTANPCIINDIVICDVNLCGGGCTYDFGLTILSLSGPSGRFQAATGFPADMTVSAGAITTTGETVLRFDAGGGKDLEIVTPPFTGGSVDLYPGQVNNTGPDAGGQVYIRGWTSLRVGNVDAHMTSGATPGSGVLLVGNGDINVAGTVNTTSPGGTNLVLLQGNRLFVNAPIINQASDGAPGIVYMWTLVGASYPQVTVNSAVQANITLNSSTAGGGSVQIVKTAGNQLSPDVFINQAVSVAATSGTAGSILVEGRQITMTGNSAQLDASASSTVGSKGGTITITATDASAASAFRTLDTRGHTGGTIRIRGNGNMQFDSDVRADSNQGSNGVGGVISIRTLTDNGIANCWDCKEPGDACACGMPTSCTQTLQINQDVIATGNGSQGVGGIITLEAPFVYMRGSGTPRRIIANATTGTDSTSGFAPGRVRVRARSSQFRAQTTDGLTMHKIRALPDQTGISETCITQPLGGSYAPPFVLCGPNYSPGCSPG